jgi:hypothetical protein
MMIELGIFQRNFLFCTPNLIVRMTFLIDWLRILVVVELQKRIPVISESVANQQSVLFRW